MAVIGKREKLFRNAYPGGGKWHIPIIRKQEIDLNNLKMIGYHNTKLNDQGNKDKTVHFFISDDKFDNVYDDPQKQITKLQQYKQTLSPDLSVDISMKPWLKIENIAHSYYCGAYWQRHGLTVIATAIWADPESFDYCFDGIDEGAVVAVSTLGTKKHFKDSFLEGFKELCRRKYPSHVLCYCKPFDEMYSIAQDFKVEIIYIPDEGNTKRKELRRNIPEQLEFPVDFFQKIPS
jgi:hypothetical protein